MALFTSTPLIGALVCLHNFPRKHHTNLRGRCRAPCRMRFSTPAATRVFPQLLPLHRRKAEKPGMALPTSTLQTGASICLRKSRRRLLTHRRPPRTHPAATASISRVCIRKLPTHSPKQAERHGMALLTSISRTSTRRTSTSRLGPGGTHHPPTTTARLFHRKQSK